MSTYSRNNDQYVPVGKQAAADMKKVAGILLKVLLFAAPMIVGVAAMVVSEKFETAIPMITIAGCSVIMALTHLAFAAMRVFGRNEHGVYKQDLEFSWFVWTKWTIWPTLCAILVLVLMSIDDINMTTLLSSLPLG